MSDKKVHEIEAGPQIIFSIDGVYSEEECQAWIDRVSDKEYHRATINGGSAGQVLDEEVRKHERYMEDDEEIAGEMWRRIEGIVREKISGVIKNEMIGLNPRLRVLRYQPGDYFRPHYDNWFMRDGTISLFTVMLYLNDGYGGGETVFLDDNDVKFKVPHRGKAGSVLIFEQEELLHEGAELTSGEKYVVRTDIMFVQEGAMEGFDMDALIEKMQEAGGEVLGEEGDSDVDGGDEEDSGEDEEGDDKPDPPQEIKDQLIAYARVDPM